MAIDEYEIKLQKIKREILNGEIKSSMIKSGKLGHRKVQEKDSSKDIKAVSNEVFKKSKES